MDYGTNDEVLNVRLPKTLLEQLKAEKARSGCPVSEQVRRALQAALKHTPSLEDYYRPAPLVKPC
jgi:predicted DNA binding CopG/RHH family protein